MPPSTRVQAAQLELDARTRADLWRNLGEELERYWTGVAQAPVAPAVDRERLRSALADWDFAAPQEPGAALHFVLEGLWRQQVHTPHPRYFGLFNPAPTAMGVLADALVAGFNPQMAAWSHNPFANEAERHLVRALAARFGYEPGSADGVFCSGGAEANHTALLCALAQGCPEYARGGARALAQPPAIYVSGQSHHSVIKAARLCGLGTDAVRVLATGADFRLAPAVLAEALARDRAAGVRPTLVVATAGTTSAGAVDDIAALGRLAAAEGAWFHVDAAWGGFAALLPELRALLTGIERADSITFDAHKSLSVPMGAGLFLTRHAHVLGKAFRVGADYMPSAQGGEGVVDPFAHSIQWSRRFTGLKLFLSLAVAGWDGYRDALRHQVAMGELLRRAAAAAGWRVVNQTPLPLVLLEDAVPRPAGFVEAVARRVVESGAAWISTVHWEAEGESRAALRACVTNYRTQPEDVRALVAALDEARQHVHSS